MPLVELTYNATPHRINRVALFKDDLGYDPHLPIDVLLGPRSKTTDGDQNAVKFVEKVELRLREIRDRLQQA